MKTVFCELTAMIDSDKARFKIRKSAITYIVKTNKRMFNTREQYILDFHNNS